MRIPDEMGRIVVLGHSGFLGSRVLARLSERTHGVEIVGLSRPALDLADKASVTRLCDTLDRHTAVILCSAIKRQLGDSIAAFESNVAMVANLCEVLQRSPVGRFVFVSSAAVYGEEHQDLAMTETTACRPTSYYGVAKVAAEHLLEQARRRHAVASLIAVRPPLIYGPGDTSRSYGPVGFIDDALDERAIHMWGDGCEQREFLYVEDAAELVCRLALSSVEGPVNLVSGQSETFADVAALVAGLAGPQVRIVSRPRSKTKVDHGFDATRLGSLFPAFRFTSLAEGVARTFAARRIDRQADATRESAA
jgi:UDP-glucose 4-epimerase